MLTGPLNAECLHRHSVVNFSGFFNHDWLTGCLIASGSLNGEL